MININSIVPTDVPVIIPSSPSLIAEAANLRQTLQVARVNLAIIIECFEPGLPARHDFESIRDHVSCMADEIALLAESLARDSA